MSQNHIRNLENLRIESIQHYLTRAGWKAVPYKRNDVFRFALTDDEGIAVSVPKVIRTSDYADAIYSVVRTVSQVEGRELLDIIRNMFSPNVDVLRFRFAGGGADIGSLPLDYLRYVVENIRDSLIFSACAEFQPKASYSRQLKPAVKLIEKSRFGQTEVGSFVITVEMPIEVPAQVADRAEGSAPATAPIERRILSRIIQGTAQARSLALEGGNFDVEKGFIHGLNANLADSLAALRRDGHEMTVEIGGSWDKSIPGIPEIAKLPVVIEERTFDSFKSISKTLRGAVVARSVNVTGLIVGLNRDDADGEDEDECTVSIRVQNDSDLPARTIKVVLTPGEYKAACDAHRDRRQISLQGTLDKPEGTTRWWLTNYSDFRVV